MAQNGKVITNCLYASNPYHECSEACSKKIKEGKPQKNKKSSGYRRSVTDGELGKKSNEDKRRNSSCPKASNPYHVCDDNCYKRMSGADSGAIPSKHVVRKKPEPPVLDSVPASKIGAIYISAASSPISHYSEKEKPESNEKIYSKPVSGEIRQQEIMPTYQKDLPKDFAKRLANPTQTYQEEDKNGSHKVFPITYADDTGGLTPTNGESTDCSILSNPHSNEDSEEEETMSVVSECRVSVGRYNVKESFAPILQSIFDKYGDIGASCHLESVVMRSYYVECVCFVVQELQSISTMQLTKSKIKELLAILKDVESAQLRVAWLRSILDEIAENTELINQHQEVEMAKTNCDGEAESLRKELELDLETLTQKEQEAAAIKARIVDARDRLKDLELKSSELDKSMSSIKSEFDKLDSKSLLDELL